MHSAHENVDHRCVLVLMMIIIGDQRHKTSVICTLHVRQIDSFRIRNDLFTAFYQFPFGVASESRNGKKKFGMAFEHISVWCLVVDVRTEFSFETYINH